MIILETDSLDKSYGLVHAVNHLNLKVESGQVYGILGPNGSGKTTTLSMLMGIVRADGGSYRWFGDQLGPAANRRIGALIETPNFYPYLSLEQNLKIVCRIKGINEKDIQRVIKLVGLYDRWHSKYQTLSLGMKQRLALGSRARCLDVRVRGGVHLRTGQQFRRIFHGGLGQPITGNSTSQEFFHQLTTSPAQSGQR